MPDEDLSADFYELTQQLTKDAGLPAYEISNHARPGEESRHNLAYWHYQDYAGIGPGAHGRRGGIATVRHRKPENWLAAVAEHGHGITDQRDLGQAEQASEALLMGLRLAEGVDLGALGKRFGFKASELLNTSKLGFHARNGLVWQHSGRIGVTEKGMPLLDGLLGELVRDELVSA
jgi:oxygen-independent coproporphyrinogen-3 oxidase